MFAIIQSGGRQVKVTAGRALSKSTASTPKPGDEVSIDRVLLFDDKDGGEVLAGAPFVANARCSASSTARSRGPKIRVFKKKRRKGSARPRVTAARYTRVRVKDIRRSSHGSQKRTRQLTQRARQQLAAPRRQAARRQRRHRRIDSRPPARPPLPPGLNVGRGKDDTLFAKVDGTREVLGPRRRAAASSRSSPSNSIAELKASAQPACGRAGTGASAAASLQWTVGANRRRDRSRPDGAERHPMFVDEVDIHVAAGHGGRGCVSFRREKFVPRGGPNGGDGGHGGSSTSSRSPHLNTLVNFRFHPEFEAERGGHGEGSNRTGRNGEDSSSRCRSARVVLRETATRRATCRLLADLTAASASACLVAQGRPRRPRQRVASRRPPTARRARSQPGLPGEEQDLRLQLKLLADVGLVGYPNAGKSHAHLAHLGGEAEDRRLPVHHADAEPRRRADCQRRSQLRRRRRAGTHRRRARRPRARPSLPRASRAHAASSCTSIDVSSASGRDPVQDFDVITRELALFPGRDASGGGCRTSR